MTQNQIGFNTTSSSPFVAPGDVIYFRGTDDRLLRINSDGSDSYSIGGNYTSSSPFAFSDPLDGEWVYFRGTRDELWKVRDDSDGTDLTRIGGNSTSSTPFVTFDATAQEVHVYFQGTDNRLLRVNGDGSGGIQIGANYTSSSPFVIVDPVDGTEWVYFRGTDHEQLWKVRGDSAGTDLTQIGTNTTSSAPFVTLDASTNEVWVYFQGTDNKLWKVRNDAAGSGLFHIGGNYTRSSPYVSDDGWVYFQGTETFDEGNTQVYRGGLWTVFNDGTQQSQIGGNYTASTPRVGAVQFVGGQLSRWVYFQEALTNNLMRVSQTENALATGTVRPKYYLLTLLYAPPGTGARSPVATSNSLVDYGSSSATGTTTTIAESIKDGFTLQFGPDDKDNAGLQFGSSNTTTTSISIQKMETFDIKVPGPAADGIDHNYDVFVLLLNPLLTVAQFPGNNVQVAMGIDGPTMNIQYVYAGWLKGVMPMAVGVRQQLDAAGLDQQADYEQILSTNPFHSGAAAIDTDRFVALPESFAYEPPYSQNDAPWLATYTVQNTTTATTEVTVEYTVGASGGLQIEFLKVGGSVTFTDSNKTTTTETAIESAAVTVGGPSFGYEGATDILVYWDSVYHSFMFTFPTPNPQNVVGKPGREDK